VVQIAERWVHAHSYRYELKTFYLGLKNVEEILEHLTIIYQYMACMQGLAKIEQDIFRLSHIMDTIISLVSSYKKLIKEPAHTIIQKWVLGHADEKYKGKLASISQ